MATISTCNKRVNVVWPPQMQYVIPKGANKIHVDYIKNKHVCKKKDNVLTKYTNDNKDLWSQNVDHAIQFCSIDESKHKYYSCQRLDICLQTLHKNPNDFEMIRKLNMVSDRIKLIANINTQK
jgi:hypothetical protein